MDERLCESKSSGAGTGSKKEGKFCDRLEAELSKAFSRSSHKHGQYVYTTFSTTVIASAVFPSSQKKAGIQGTPVKTAANLHTSQQARRHVHTHFSVRQNRVERLTREGRSGFDCVHS